MFVVSDHEGREAAGAVKLVQQVQDGARVGGVEVAGRLVREKQLRSCDDRASEGDALLFADGEAAGLAVKFVGEADLLEGGGGLAID